MTSWRKICLVHIIYRGTFTAPQVADTVEQVERGQVFLNTEKRLTGIETIIRFGIFYKAGVKNG